MPQADNPREAAVISNHSLKLLVRPLPSITPSATTGGYIAHRGHWSSWSGDNRISELRQGHPAFPYEDPSLISKLLILLQSHFAMIRASIVTPMAVVILGAGSRCYSGDKAGASRGMHQPRLHCLESA